MNTFIATSTASDPLGLPTGQKCLVVKSGQYSNRIAILFASSAANISLVWADTPYESYSTPVNVVTDSADSPFDAFINVAGDIYIAYTISGSNDLGFVKLTFENGSWSVGSPVTVYDGDDNYYPSICKLSSDYLWIAYTRVSSGSHYISAKVSGDDGATWGTVSDPGDTLTSGANAAFCKMLEAGIYQYVFYSEGGNKIAYRRKLNSGIIWNSEVILASEGGYSENISASISFDGRIGVAYASSSGLKFREYSGSAWSGEFLVDDNLVKGPAVSYQGGIAYLIYNRSYGTNMNLVLYSKRVDEIFYTPAPLDTRKCYLQGVVVFDSSAGTYQDKTGEASSTESADIFHSNSGTLLSALGDSAFFGTDNPFHYIALILSTAGSGGEIVWKYWDGQGWKAFTPTSGPWHFSSTEKSLLLWPDYNSIPTDWQKKSVFDQDLYWISATVTSTFTISPIGTQITTVSNLQALAVQV